jgi:glutamate-ammonia-ligase adenylyltransferase
MALCRARPLFGSDKDRAALTAIIDTILHTPRDPATLRDDVLAMRGEMARHKPAKGPMDVKLARGGLVDLEFIVHFLQLRDGIAIDPSLGEAVSGLAAAGLLPPDLRGAHDLLARLLVVVRLVAPDGTYPPLASRGIVAHACGLSDWDALLAAIDEARHAIAQAWSATFAQTLEL